jgi:hypothetical protein
MAAVARTNRDDEATKIQKAIFLKHKARVTSLVARSAASRMLGYTCELEIKHHHRTFPSTHVPVEPFEFQSHARCWALFYQCFKYFAQDSS